MTKLQQHKYCTTIPIRSVGVTPPESVEVPIIWLEQLYKLSMEARKAQDKWFETEKPLMPTSISKLIGYASSAKTIILYGKHEKEADYLEKNL